jgi:hypothetical protein
MLIQQSTCSDSIVANRQLVGDFCNTIRGEADITPGVATRRMKRYGTLGLALSAPGGFADEFFLAKVSV